MKKQVIVIAQQGWVFAGVPVAGSSEETYALEEAGVIRRWGTKRGLGELALMGAQPETCIDPVGYVEVLKSSIVAVISVSEGVWLPTI